MPNDAMPLTYSYLVTLGASLGIFWLTIKYPQKTSIVNPFELVKHSNSSISGVLSGIALIVLMTAMLLFLRFVMQELGNTFKIFFLVISLNASLAMLLEVKPLRYVPWHAKYQRTTVFLHIMMGFLVGGSWSVFPSWLTYDLAFVALTYYTIGSIGAIKLRTFFIGFIMLIAFDIWGVFITGFIIDLALRIEGLRVPLLFMVPQNPFVLDMRYQSALGSGDVVISGIAVLTAQRFKLTRFVLWGYVVGLVATILFSFVLNRPVPALITLIPCLLGSFLIGYYQKYRFGKPPEILENTQ